MYLAARTAEEREDWMDNFRKGTYTFSTCMILCTSSIIRDV